MVIEVENKEVERLPLSQYRIVHVTGPIGETEVEIKDGKARVRKSPCNRKLCIKSGYIQYADRFAAYCLTGWWCVYSAVQIVASTPY